MPGGLGKKIVLAVLAGDNFDEAALRVLYGHDCRLVLMLWGLLTYWHKLRMVITNSRS